MGRSGLGLLCLLVGLFISTPLRAQQPPTEPLWVTMPGTATLNGVSMGESLIRAVGSATDTAGNTFVVGGFHGRATFGTNVLVALGSYPGMDIFLVKYDSGGRVIWARSAGGVDADQAKGIALDTSGNIFITGEITSQSATFGTNTLTGFGSTLFVAKYDSTGECLWARRAGPWLTPAGPGGITAAGYMTAGGLMADTAGNVVVAGSFAGNPMFGGVLTNASFLYNFSGGLILTNSNTNAAGGSYDLFLAKYDSAGSLLWAKAHGATNNEAVNSMALDSAGGIYVAGSFIALTVLGPNTYTNLPSLTGPFVAKFDNAGGHVWSSSLGEGTNGRTASAIGLTVTTSGLATVAFQTRTSPYNIGSLSVTNLESDPGFQPV